MTKNQIIAEILAKPLVGKQIALRLGNTLTDGTKVYVLEVLEVLDNAATQRVVSFYVVDEGLGTEIAYYKDIESIPQIQSFNDKLKPLLKQYNASIVEQGETWALAETNILVDTAGVWSIQKDRYMLVDGETLTITKIG